MVVASLTAVNPLPPTERQEEQPNPKKTQDEIQNVFRETCCFKGRCRGPPGAHYSSQCRGGVGRVWSEKQCLSFSKTYKDMNNNPSPNLFAWAHRPQSPLQLSSVTSEVGQAGYTGQVYPGKMPAVRHTDMNPPPGKVCFTQTAFTQVALASAMWTHWEPHQQEMRPVSMACLLLHLF